MMQFQKNAQTDGSAEERTEGWTEGQKDGRTYRPYFIGSFRLLPRVQLKV